VNGLRRYGAAQGKAETQGSKSEAGPTGHEQRPFRGEKLA